jgi:hypothetical protein
VSAGSGLLELLTKTGFLLFFRVGFGVNFDFGSPKYEQFERFLFL